VRHSHCFDTVHTVETPLIIFDFSARSVEIVTGTSDDKAKALAESEADSDVVSKSGNATVPA
jgi:hypothetical protein